MSCCSEPGEILVVPRTGGFEATRETVQRESPGPLPWDVVSSWEDILKASLEGGESTDPFDRKAELRSAPFVVNVPEEVVEETLARLRHDDRIVTATRNWRVSLEGRGATAAEIAAFLREAAVRPAPEPVAGGRPVRVGIVDSGVAPGAVAPGVLHPVQVDVSGIGSSLRTAPEDPDGHGSTIAGIVNHLYPGAKITSIRAFVRGGALLSDIVYAILLGRLLSDPVDIFNLSFSVTASYEVCPACGEAAFPVDERPAMHLLFEHLRMELSDRPILIAAAGNSGGRVATPADLLGVIAVGSTGDSPRDSPSPEPSYAKVPEYFVLADGGSKAEPVGTTGGRHSGARFGTSYATAVVTGLLSGLLANGAAYDIPDTRGEVRWGLANANLRKSASRDFPGYDSDVHGLGVLRALAGPDAGGAATGSLEW